MKTIPAILLTLAIAVPVTWFAAQKLGPKGGQPSTALDQGKQGARKLLYYQSAMHPWIKSDKPGRCTICGMELTPVYEGDAGFDSSGGEVVPLTQSMIQVLNVETAEAKVSPITKTLTVAGMIDDNATRHRILSAYVPGRIDKLYVNFMGAEVTEGQPLAEFYSPSLLQAEREYRTLSGELRSATALRLRQMGLSSKQIEDLATKAADKLSSQILAPIGGTVVAQNAYEGQYLQEGEKLFEIGDFSTMWFQFRAYEQDLPWIKVGLQVEVTTTSVPGHTFEGKITFIDPNFEETTRSTKVRVELNNPLVDGRRLLLHRLYADGAVHLEAPEALSVPRSAVIQTGPQAVVYVEQGAGAYGRRAVKVGRRGDENLEILSGLSAGDKVVINGNLLIDGQAEMNRAFAQKPNETEPMAKTNTVPVTDSQKPALTAFIKSNDKIALALAHDDLAQFNAASEEVVATTEVLAEALKDREDVKDILTHISEARNLHGAKDIAEARKLFHPFANASAKMLELLASGSNVFSDFQIFECPMVDKGVPGAPKKGRWVQAAGRPIGNPYLGSPMIDCGKRVMP